MSDRAAREGQNPPQNENEFNPVTGGETVPEGIVSEFAEYLEAQTDCGAGRAWFMADFIVREVCRRIHQGPNRAGECSATPKRPKTQRTGKVKRKK